MQPAFERFMVGSVECVAVTDGSLRLPATNLFFNAPAQDLAKALSAYGTSDGYVDLPFNPLVVRTDGATILIDTGFGPGVAPTLGHLVDNLASAGISADAVDVVVLSHAHADHSGGAITEAGELAFPNARVILNQDEAVFWLSEEAAQKDGPRTKAARRVIDAIWDHMDTILPGEEVVPGVSIVAAAGHTPFNTAVRIESDGETMIYVADAIAHPIHLQHTEWYLQADLDPDAAVATRVALLRQAQRENALISGYHMPLPGVGRVREAADGGTWTWEAL